MEKRKYDAIVVGASVLGACIARKLALKDVDVLILDKETPGFNELGNMDSICSGGYFKEDTFLFSQVLSRIEDIEKRCTDFFRKRWGLIKGSRKQLDELMTRLEDLKVSFTSVDEGLLIFDRIIDGYTFMLLNLLDALEKGAFLKIHHSFTGFKFEENGLKLKVLDHVRHETLFLHAKAVILTINAWVNRVLAALGINLPVRFFSSFTLVLKGEENYLVKPFNSSYTIIPYEGFTLIYENTDEVSSGEYIEAYSDTIDRCIKYYRRHFGEPPPIHGVVLTAKAYSERGNRYGGGYVWELGKNREHGSLLVAVSPKIFLSEIISDTVVKKVLTTLGLDPDLPVKPLPARSEIPRALERIPLPRFCSRPFFYWC